MACYGPAVIPSAKSIYKKSECSGKERRLKALTMQERLEFPAEDPATFLLGATVDQQDIGPTLESSPFASVDRLDKLRLGMF